VDDDEIFRASATDRLAFADLLEGLTAEQLAAPSLCGQWDVATVGAHLAAAITTKLASFAVLMVRNGGSFDRANDANAKRTAKRGIGANVTTIRDNANSRFTPPRLGPRAPLTDVLVHTGDITRPLGLPQRVPDNHVKVALGFLATKPIGFVKPRSLDGLELFAEDYNVRIGRGEELRGCGIDVMMAMCGRTIALDELEGDGVEVLRSRLA